MIIGQIEEWCKKVCKKHNCKYYIREDYPKCSYCTCPNNCILVDKPKVESDDKEVNIYDRVATANTRIR